MTRREKEGARNQWQAVAEKELIDEKCWLISLMLTRPIFSIPPL